MSGANRLFLLTAVTVVLWASISFAQTEVNISLNVFPTDLANPDGGGDWSLVAKTDAPNGIGAINAILLGVNNGSIANGDPQNDITIPGDIGAIDPIITSSGPRAPYLDLGGGVTDLIYGQNISMSSGVVLGVGTAGQSDGPDPLGDLEWNVFTLIAIGTYSATVPSFTNSGSSVTNANILTSASNAMAAVPVTTVVRVAVPEPASIALCIVAFSVFSTRRRR